MTATIYPSLATVDAQTRPYTAVFTVQTDYQPAYVQWYVGSLSDYGTSVSTSISPTLWQASGPTVNIYNSPVTIRVVVTKADATTEQATYTTANLHATPTVAVTVQTQQNGIPITNDVSVPLAPLTTSLAGLDRLTVVWDPGAPGQAARSDVHVRVTGSCPEHKIRRINFAWGDAVENEDVEGVSAVNFHKAHTYSGVTGAITITASLYDAGNVLRATGTANITIPADATGFRADQYQILQYQDQPGYRQMTPIGWRDASGAARSHTLYNVLRAHTYYYQLQLRSVDTTGRPIATSALSSPSSVGPWS